ncbi:MAG: SRPBCC family protein [Vicinamibacteraceae bacterium]|nr:SRPBCC family protein [Vicinamibacteraceae bacterium]
MPSRNVGRIERMASLASGALLLGTAGRFPRATTLARAAGAGLVARGLAGYCPVKAAAGSMTHATRPGDAIAAAGENATREALSGSGGVLVEERVLINRPAHEVYDFWRRLTTLPIFMPHLVSVVPLDDRRSRWTVKGPLGTQVSWEAEIINDLPGERLAWQTVGDADVYSAGSVNFEPRGERQSEVRVRLQYAPPAGRAGAWVASLLGRDPASQIRDDLGRLKGHLEWQGRGPEPGITPAHAH